VVASPEFPFVFTSPIFATQGMYSDEAEESADRGLVDFIQLQASLHATALGFLEFFDW